MKNILKTICLFLVVTLFSCSDDLYENSNNPSNQKLIITERKFDELILNTEFNNSFDKLARNSNRTARITNYDPKTTIENQFNFKISETPVKVIEVNNKTSYTIAITRKNQIENYFENLIIEIDTLNHTKAFINKYIPTARTIITSDGKVDFKGTVESKSIQLNSGEPSCDVYCQTYIGDLCQDSGDLYCGGSVCGYYVETICTGGGSSSGSSFGTTGLGDSTGTGGYGSSSGVNGSSSGNQVVDPSNWILHPAIPPDNIATGINLSDIDLNTPKITSQFYNLLTLQQQQYLDDHYAIYKTIKQYLIQNMNNQQLVSSNALDFAGEIINLAINEPNQADVNNLVNITLKLDLAGTNLFEDSTALSLDPYIDLDLATLSTLSTQQDPITPNLVILKWYLKYRLLRQVNQGWSYKKCAWEAGKDIIHLSLDAFGLIPVAGEVADLVNGALYTIEGDGLNATLSYASAIPIVGWASAGTKFGIKIATTATGTTKFVWKVTNNIIQFGNRGQLRKVLNLAVGNPLVAHHIMPWAKSGHEIIQKAAKSSNAFHMNEALNGIAVAGWRNQRNHNTYDNLIISKLDAFKNLYPNATPQQCYNFLTDLINDIRTWIINNPNSHLNDLVLP